MNSHTLLIQKELALLRTAYCQPALLRYRESGLLRPGWVFKPDAAGMSAFAARIRQMLGWYIDILIGYLIRAVILREAAQRRHLAI